MEIIKETNYRETMEKEVVPYIESVRNDGYFDGFDGIKLHYVCYKCEKPVKTAVILHGFTESAEKYREMIYYFLKAGFNVYLYEQRCHGKSGRLVDDKTLTHVDRFEDYVKDFEIFTEKVVPKTLPLVLYSHSMGGAVSALYLQRHADVFEKAVFSSPMIAPTTGGFPKFVSQAVCKTATVFGKSKKRLFIAGEYPGKEEFDTSCGTSFERFSFYENLKRSNSDYQNYSPTYRWTLEALNVTKKILKKGEAEKITLPSLLFSAGLDNMVKLPEQKMFADRIKNCELITYDTAKHEIFFSTDDVMEKYINKITDFLSK
ncbi:MAG: alpha/beta hydrolase [Clostridia bacterium]|nr:alpha/beta hydrolase [Clostridia bacterium]